MALQSPFQGKKRCSRICTDILRLPTLLLSHPAATLGRSKLFSSHPFSATTFQKHGHCWN